MASTYLTRTPASSGNRKTWTLSTWVKRSVTGSGGVYYSQGTTGGSLAYIGFNSGDLMEIAFDSEVSGNFRSDMAFRDLNAWYHIVIACDTTQATASNRVKAWVNGSQITFGTETQPSQNYDTQMNTTTLIELGKQSNGGSYFFNGLLAHYHFIDGIAISASAFGETDTTTGIWKPKTAPTVTYGTNGFFLKFENSASFGTDSSPNANNFTVNGTMTQTIDTPSNVFATGNPLYRGTHNNLFSNGNLTFTGSGEANPINIATIQPSAGKWYWETKPTNIATAPLIGMAWNGYVSGGTGRIIYYPNGTIVTPDGNATSASAGFSVNDIIGCALDLDSGTTTLKFYTNGTLVYTYNDVTTGLEYSTRGEGMIFWQLYTSDVVSANFGNGYFGTTAVSSAENPDDGIGIFEYEVPAGYKALCTKSINAQEYS